MGHAWRVFVWCLGVLRGAPSVSDAQNVTSLAFAATPLARKTHDQLIRPGGAIRGDGVNIVFLPPCTDFWAFRLMPRNASPIAWLAKMGLCRRQACIRSVAAWVVLAPHHNLAQLFPPMPRPRRALSPGQELPLSFGVCAGTEWFHPQPLLPRTTCPCPEWLGVCQERCRNSWHS